jgi:1,4-dihydroxy-2-naphthoyl-CoA hydrolase
MMSETPEQVVERLNASRHGTVLEPLDIKIVEATLDHVTASMPVGPNQRQNVGYLHGGVSVVLAETVASIGSYLHIDQERQMTFGLEINANHVRPKREGTITATATLVHLGRTTHIWDIKIVDENGKLVCISRCTMAVVDRAPTA